MKIVAKSCSDRGYVRKDNQDSVLVLGQHRLYAVADGMGGAAEGARASRMVCEALKMCKLPQSGDGRKRRLTEAVSAANAAIGSYAVKHGLRQMGSTVAMLALGMEVSDRAHVGHVGDSRVYRIRGGVAKLLTKDHTVGAEISARVGKAKGAMYALRSNPLAHVLTRAIGTDPEVEVEWHKVEVRSGDRFLVCSDGVHDVIETAELGELVSGAEIKRSSARLAKIVADRGAPDNYSFVLLEVE